MQDDLETDSGTRRAGVGSGTLSAATEYSVWNLLGWNNNIT